MKNPLISIVIVAYKRPQALSNLLDSIYDSSYKNIEIIIINNSDKSFKDAYEKIISKYPEIVHVWSENNLMLAGAWNKGFELSKGDLILFSGDDYIFDKDMLRELTDSLLAADDIGIVGPMFYYSNGELLIPACALSLSTGMPLLKKYTKGNNEVNIIDCVLLVKRKVIEEIGKFDEKNFKFYLESADLCMRAKRKGYKCLIRFEAKAQHDHLPMKAYIIVHPERYKNPLTYYYLMSTKIKYIRKYANIFQRLVFFLFFLPLLTIWHVSIIVIWGREKPMARIYHFIQGVINGIFEKL